MKKKKVWSSTIGPPIVPPKSFSLELRLRRREEVPRVEVVVAVEGEQRSVELVGSALGRQVDHAARRAAELGCERTGLDFELGQRIDGRQQADFAVCQVVVVDAVENEVVSPETAAVDVGVARHGKPVFSPWESGDHTGRQEVQPQEAASIQRKVVDFVAVDDLP